MSEMPIFRKIFGENWESLPSVFRNHYGNRPYTKDKTSVTGTLDVYSNAYIMTLSPLLRLLGSAPAANESNVAVSVDYTSDEHSNAFYFDRTFYFNNRKTYHFRSRMVQVKANEIVEIMRFCICWRALYQWENQKVLLKHNGYALRIAGRLIPLPISFLFGDVNAEETAISDTEFTMRVTITHRLFGKMYEYKGQFRLI